MNVMAVPVAGFPARLPVHTIVTALPDERAAPITTTRVSYVEPEDAVF